MGTVGGAAEWCHTYYWRVRASTPDDEGPWSATFSTDIVPPDGLGECPPQRVDARATVNAACRIGPGTLYGVTA